MAIGKAMWLHGYRGEGIKAAKAQQHRPVPGHDGSRTADTTTQGSPEVSQAGLPDINVMDSVLSLDGVPARARSQNSPETMPGKPSVKERYLKKGLGTLSWLQKANMAVNS